MERELPIYYPSLLQAAGNSNLNNDDMANNYRKGALFALEIENRSIMLWI
jgi:hypothetical protein